MSNGVRFSGGPSGGLTSASRIYRSTHVSKLTPAGLRSVTACPSRKSCRTAPCQAGHVRSGVLDDTGRVPGMNGVQGVTRLVHAARPYTGPGSKRKGLTRVEQHDAPTASRRERRP